MCILRPCRFGKTLALYMLNAYYSKGCDSKDLFSNLKISSNPLFDKYLNKHNVIMIDLQEVYREIKDESSLIDELHRTIIEDLNNLFPNILTENESIASKAFKKINEETGETFIFLIDEWDAVLRLSDNENIKNEFMNFLITLFKGGNTSSCFDLVYMTGILPIKRYASQSSLNMFEEYTMLNSQTLSEYFGFTKDEVKELCLKYDMDFNMMKQWYDGYNLNGIEVYNPKSVVKAIKSRVYENYWTYTSSVETANNYIKYQNGIYMMNS